jgi:hypothetical protein
MNKFGKAPVRPHRSCGTDDVTEMEFFLDRRPLELVYAGGPVAGIVPPAGIMYVQLSDTSEAVGLAGKVFVDGQVAKAGTRVQALAGDVVCGETSVEARDEGSILFPEDGRYWLLIDGDARREGCGAVGRQFTFRIDGRPANETVDWDPKAPYGGAVRLTVGVRDGCYYGFVPGRRRHQVRTLVDGHGADRQNRGERIRIAGVRQPCRSVGEGRAGLRQAGCSRRVHHGRLAGRRAT